MYGFSFTDTRNVPNFSGISLENYLGFFNVYIQVRSVEISHWVPFQILKQWRC